MNFPETRFGVSRNRMFADFQQHQQEGPVSSSGSPLLSRNRSVEGYLADAIAGFHEIEKGDFSLGSSERDFDLLEFKMGIGARKDRPISDAYGWNPTVWQLSCCR